MRRLWSLATGLLMLGVVAGCCPNQNRIATPDLFHPRSANVQRKRATRFDPYPDPNAGPEMVGVRPREYENPPAEVSRARWTRYKEAMFPNPQRWNTDGKELESPVPCP
jgi:hypothetical protein